jgi:hypothetical protein
VDKYYTLFFALLSFLFYQLEQAKVIETLIKQSFFLGRGLYVFDVFSSSGQIVNLT